MKTIPLFSCLVLCAAWAFAEEKAAAPVSSAPVPAAVSETVPKSGIEVLRLVLAKDVQDREPVEEIQTAKIGDVVVGWSQIRSGVGEISITHRWLHDGKTESDVSLPVHGSPWRTWSRKTISEPGAWSLQVLNPQGEVLKEVSFTANP